MPLFTSFTPLTRITLARAEAINAYLQAIADSFALFPDAAKIVSGTTTFGLDEGEANAYVVNLDPAPSAYTTGMTVDFKAVNANTGASTINVNSLGVKTIRTFDGGELAAGQIPVGSIVTVRYDGTVFRLNNIVALSIPADDSVTTAKVADGAITGPKLGAAAVSTAKVEDGAITSAKVATNTFAPFSHVGAGSAAHAAATTSAAGFMAAADKTKLDGIATGAQVNVPTNLAAAIGPTQITVTSSTGTNAVIPAANTDDAGLMTAALWDKLAAVNNSSENIAQARFLSEDGSVSAPGFSWSDDANTGIYRGSDSRMYLVINGAIQGVVDTVDGGSNAKGLMTRDGSKALFMGEATLDGLGVDGESATGGLVATITMPEAGFILAWCALHTVAVDSVAVRLALSISGTEVNARSFTGNSTNAGMPLTIVCFGVLDVAAGGRGITATVTGTSTINLNFSAQGFCNG